MLNQLGFLMITKNFFSKFLFSLAKYREIGIDLLLRYKVSLITIFSEKNLTTCDFHENNIL